MVDALIVRENDNVLRMRSFGEFESIYVKNNKVSESFKEISSIIVNFHPDTSPILWRVLLAQAILYRIIIMTYRQNTSIINISESSLWLSSEEYKKL